VGLGFCTVSVFQSDRFIPVFSAVVRKKAPAPSDAKPATAFNRLNKYEVND
jgi:hypothetical protein